MLENVQITGELVEHFLTQLKDKAARGDITWQDLEWMVAMPPRAPRSRRATVMSITEDKFVYLPEEFVIQVPKKFDPHTAIARYREKYPEQSGYLEEHFKDEAYGEPPHVLKSGTMYLVRLCVPTGHEKTSIEERVAFLRDKEHVLLGVQGALMILEQRAEVLPDNFAFLSFNTSEAPPTIVTTIKKGETFRIPAITSFEGQWPWNVGFFHFTQIK